jgi:DNA-directed RNA polymerase specialized sigma24 family protein
MTVHGAPSPPHPHVTPRQCDRSFGRELVRRHAEALARVASLILGDDDAADEVVSDTIAAVCRLDDQPEQDHVTRVRFARSVYHRCLGLLATYERFGFHSGREAPLPRDARVSTMSDSQRAAVALVLFGDHDLTQAAATLNLSPAAVTRHLRDATSKLAGGSPPR